MSNTPTLTQSQEASAPWNEPSCKTCKVTLLVGMSLSKEFELPIAIPEDVEDKAKYIEEHFTQKDLMEMIRDDYYLLDECSEIDEIKYDFPELQNWSLDDYYVQID